MSHLRCCLPLFLVVLLLSSLLLLPTSSSEPSSTCLGVYIEGGAPAVLRSAECPSWNFTPYHDDNTQGRLSATSNCDVAVDQGRRRTQEDRAVCDLIRTPLMDSTKTKHVINVGVAAVFDGHNGAEASEMASKLLLKYFSLHLHFLLLEKEEDAALCPARQHLTYTGGEPADTCPRAGFDPERLKRMLLSSSPADDTSHLAATLKESLLRTIHDIDAAFSEEAASKGLASGSTATVALITADGQIMTAYVGDSKAILCSESSDPPLELKGKERRLIRRRQRELAREKGYDEQKLDTSMASGQIKYVHVKELSRDHHPDRHDERMRVEAAGGFVDDRSGVPRVNGRLAVSRAIGDVSLKSFGVISTPEVTEWQALGSNDSYLVVASDGVFDKICPQDACELLQHYLNGDAQQDQNPHVVFRTSRRSMADYLVNTAFERGSTDNLSAVVVPLKSHGQKK